MAGKDWRQSDAFFLGSKILFFSCLFNICWVILNRHYTAWCAHRSYSNVVLNLYLAYYLQYLYQGIENGRDVVCFCTIIPLFSCKLFAGLLNSEKLKFFFHQFKNSYLQSNKEIALCGFIFCCAIEYR